MDSGQLGRSHATHRSHRHFVHVYWLLAKSGKGHEELHVGPHWMIVSPYQDDYQRFNRDPSNGMPYVTHLPNSTELYLVMPIRQWDEHPNLSAGEPVTRAQSLEMFATPVGLGAVVLEKMRVAYVRGGLLISQSDDGIDARSATGWNVAGEKRHSEKHGRHGGKCKRVAGVDAVEQAGHHTR